MKKSFLIGICVALLLTSCAHEYNQVYKTTDNNYKYEFAKECFAKGKYGFAVPLLQDLVTIEKGTDNAEECLYMLAMGEYGLKDYEAASETFKKYYQTYPRGRYAEMASFYIGQSLFEGTPESRLDQTPTIAAIAAFQDYLDIFPEGKMKSTAQNALNDYPYSNLREDFSILIMKSKYELAQMSVESKKLQRYQDAEDECYGFINEYPNSKERKTAEDFIKKCKQITKD